MKLDLGNRIVLTVGVALIALFVVALVGYHTRAQQRAPVDLYGDTPPDLRLLQLDKRALDEAYNEQLIKLWNVWLQGGANDPQYFRKGLSNARRAYHEALRQIAERERLLLQQDQPPP